MLKLQTCLVPRPPGKAGRHPETEPQNLRAPPEFSGIWRGGGWASSVSLPSHQRSNECLSFVTNPRSNLGRPLEELTLPPTELVRVVQRNVGRGDTCSSEEGRTFAPLAPPELGETEAQLRDSRPGSRYLSEEIKIVGLDFRFPVPQGQVASMAGLLFLPSKDRPRSHYYLQESPSPGMAGSMNALGQSLDLFRFYLKPPALLKMT